MKCLPVGEQPGVVNPDMALPGKADWVPGEDRLDWRLLLVALSTLTGGRGSLFTEVIVGGLLVSLSMKSASSCLDKPHCPVSPGHDHTQVWSLSGPG